MAIKKLYFHPNKIEELHTLCPNCFTKSANSNNPTETGIVCGKATEGSGSTFNSIYETFGGGTASTDMLEKVDEDNTRIACYIIGTLSEEVDGVTMPYVEYDDTTLKGYNGVIYVSIEGEDISNLNPVPVEGRYSRYAYTGSSSSLDSVLWGEGKPVEAVQSSSNKFLRISFDAPNAILSSIYVDGNIPIFVDADSCRDYIETGNVQAGKCFNLDNMMLSEPTQYMISTRTYEYDSDKNCIAQDNDTHTLYIRTFDRQKISGYLKEDGSKYNIGLNVEQGTSNIDTIQYRVGSGTFETITITDFMNSQYAKGFNTWKDFKPYGISGYVKGNLWRSTIPICKDRQDSDLYNSDLNRDKVVPLNFDSEGNPVNMSDTGTPATSEADLNDEYKEGTSGIVTLYQLSKANLVTIGNKLFSYDTDILNAFKVFGDSPINAVVSLYHTPIDISSMCYLSADSIVKLGLYNLTCEGAQTVTKYGKIQQLGSIIVNPFYNDFRDYNNFEFELHLPFSTPIPLDAREIMNKTLTIKATCDAYAMQMRYYVCIDGVVKKTIDCSFGHQVAIMGNDFAGKAKETRQEIFNLATVGVNIATGSFSRVDSANQTTDVLNVGNITSSASGAQASLNNLTKEPAKTMVGNFASGCAECDVFYPYLSITETASIKPNNLASTYGRPTNYIGRLGNLTGYTCAELTRLQVDCTSAEREEIIALLERGIIL